MLRMQAKRRPKVIKENAETFAAVAEVNPGMVSTLSALVGQLESGPLPDPDVLRAYGQVICRLGSAVIGRADNLAEPEPPPVIETTP